MVVRVNPAAAAARRVSCCVRRIVDRAYASAWMAGDANAAVTIQLTSIVRSVVCSAAVDAAVEVGLAQRVRPGTDGRVVLLPRLEAAAAIKLAAARDSY